MQKMKEKTTKALNAVKLHARNAATLVFNFGIAGVMIANGAREKIKKKLSGKKPVVSDATREKRENLFFKIIGYGSIPVCAALLVFWGEDVKGSTKALADQKITATAVGGFDKDSRNCNVFIEPYRTRFNGVAADGQEVSGTVCRNYIGGKRVVLNSAL